MKAARSKIVNRAPAARPAAAPPQLQRRVAGRSAVGVQPALRVSSPSDPAEKEAEATGKRVMRMSIPESSVAFVGRGGGGVFRKLPATKPEREEPPAVRRKVADKEKEKPEVRRKVAEEKKEKPEVRRKVAEKEREKPEVLRKVAEKEKEKPGVQRKAAEKEKEKPPVQRKVAEERKEKPEVRRAWQSPYAARIAAPAGKGREEERIQRKAEGLPDASSNVASDIQGSLSAGDPLPLSVRRFMEPRFGADFGGVRVHADPRAASLNQQVNARAFAYGNHLFFGRDQYRPETEEGKELIAHELTHTIQQGSSPQRAEDAAVAEQSGPQVQRLGISDALDYFADHANLIPGFRMFTIVLGVNPVNMSRVDRSAANILRAVVEFIPGGGLITRALDSHGVFERVGGWVAQQIETLGLVGSSIRASVMEFLDSLSWRDVFRLGSVWERAKRIFTAPIDRIKSFVRGLITGILDIVKEVVLRPLARLAEGTRGYDLLKAVLGQDPITGDPYPRNADTLIGGFMKLIGQEEVWQNLKRANAVARAWAWFQGALGGLLGFVRQIPTLFLGVLRSLGIRDLVALPTAFARVVGVFTGVAGRFLSWAGAQVMQLLQIIFEVVAPGAMPYLRRIGGAFQSIIRNPMGFVGNLVRAGLLGFRQFGRNFLSHLRTSLIGWLTGAMAGAGVYVPQAFNLREIIKFVLSVLGLTWQNLRQKLVRVVGEAPVAAMESGFELVRTLVTEGPAAAWEQIQQGVANLRDMVMEQVMSFVQTRIVQAAITRLVTSLNPAGAFIQAVIAIYNTVMFFVERLRQISQVAMSFLNSMAAIASGAIGAAANRVEQTMGGLLTLVISFMARLVGLGRVSDAVKNIIDRVRAPISRAMDRVVDWIVGQARRLGRFVVQAGVPQDPAQRLRLALDAGAAVASRFAGRAVGRAVLTPLLAAIRVRYQLASIDVVPRGARWAVRAVVNPEGERESDALVEGAAGAQPAAGAAAAWPVSADPPSRIRVPESRFIERVTGVTADRITYSAGAGTVTRIRASFMDQWSSGAIRLASGASAAEIRAYLTEHYGARVADAVMRRGELAENIASAGTGQAHHIIPVEVLLDQEIVQQLVQSGWNFNAALNGVPLEEGFHGNHPAYTAYVTRRIRNWRQQRTGVVATLVTDFRTFVTDELIPQLRVHIEAARSRYGATSVNLNTYFSRLP